MTSGVILGVAGMLFVAFALHLIIMILTFVVFWPDAFLNDTIQCLIGMVVIGISSVMLRMFIPHLIENMEFRAHIPPRRTTVIFRFACSFFVCLFTIGYCLAAVYYGLVQPGHRTPIFVVYTIWMLSAFPMSFFMVLALRGIHFEGLHVPTIIKDLESEKRTIVTQ